MLVACWSRFPARIPQAIPQGSRKRGFPQGSRKDPASAAASHNKMSTFTAYFPAMVISYSQDGGRAGLRLRESGAGAGARETGGEEESCRALATFPFRLRLMQFTGFSWLITDFRCFSVHFAYVCRFLPIFATCSPHF